MPPQWIMMPARPSLKISLLRCYAIHHHTAAELIVDRANHNKPAMGLTNWKNAPEGKVIKSDVTTPKNYLNSEEIKSLDRFTTMYLD